MSNTFNDIVPTAFEAAKKVARELTPAVSLVTTNFKPEVAVGDTIKIPVAGSATSGAYTPSMTTGAGTDSSDEAISFSLTVNDQTSWHLTGEQQRSLSNAGMLADWQKQKLEQGMRKLVNGMEALVLLTAKKGASRAVGTAGTTPFATTLGILPDLRKVLTDNGCPDDGQRAFVIDTTVAANALNLAVLQQANTAGDSEVMVNGRIAKRLGFDIRESSQIALHTKGTGSGYLVDLGAGYAVGDRTIHVDTGTGTIVDGDVITIAGTSHKYVVNSGFAGDGDGDIVIGRPGLLVAEADNDAITIGNNYTPNVAFHRSAILLASRVPEIPDGNGSMKQTVITDEVSGLSFLLVEVVGDGMVTWRLHAVYGAAAVNSEFIAIGMG